MRTYAAVVAVLLLAGCGAGTSVEDTGPLGIDGGSSLGPDAERAPDAGVSIDEDAGAPDGASDDAISPIDGDALIPDPDAPACACDDGVACTVDTCAGGTCEHAVDHGACPPGGYCDPVGGCTAGAVCLEVADCARVDACLPVTCDARTRRCVYAPLDGDGDGHPPEVCGGDDCDDSSPTVYAGASPDVCDGIDTDCSGGPDPLDAPGCGSFEVCVDGACGCPDMCPSVFGTTCTDLTRDPDHCGACNNPCPAFGSCVAGTCSCPAGATVCPSRFGSEDVCVDLATDRDNCGTCGTLCGEASCGAGSCRCAAGMTLCPSTFDGDLECGDLRTDYRHCGTCDNTCLDSSTCTGTCAFDTGTFLRAWGGATSTPYASRWEADGATGASVAIASIGTTLRDLPSGALMSIPAGERLFQFSADGSLVRHLAMGTYARAVDIEAGVIAVGLGFTTATATFAGLTLTRPAGATATFALVRLDASTGAATLVRTFGFGAGDVSIVVAADGSMIVSGRSSDAMLDLGTGPLPLGDRNVGFVVGLDAAGATRFAARIPGRLFRADSDGAGGVVLLATFDGFPAPAAPFALGGAMLTGARGGYAAHFGPTGAHLHSFEMPGTERGAGGPRGVAVATASALHMFRFTGMSAVETVTAAGAYSGLEIESVALTSAGVVVGGHATGDLVFGDRTILEADRQWWQNQVLASLDETLAPTGLAFVSTQDSQVQFLRPFGARRLLLCGPYSHYVGVGTLGVSASARTGIWLGDTVLP